MTKNIDLKAMRKVAHAGALGCLLEGLKQRKRFPIVFSLDKAHEIAGGPNQCNRQEVSAALDQLEAFGAGLKIVGRKGHPTRFDWWVRPVTLLQELDGNAPTFLIDDISEVTDEEDGMNACNFLLRNDLTIHLKVPMDMTTRERDRLADWIRLLPASGE